MKTKQSKTDKQLDKDIERAWYRLASGVQVNIMDIPKIFRECRVAVLAGQPLDTIVQECIGRYRQDMTLASNLSPLGEW